jgi:hypothetical protein
MALEAPLRSSTGNIHFPFSYQETMSTQSDNEGHRSSFRVVSSPPPATHSASLRPSSAQRISSNSMHLLSPSDIVGPSPVTSNGTETTEIEDDASEEIKERRSVEGGSLHRSSLQMLTTNIPESVRHPSSEEAVSVIHAPESFASWVR